MKILDFIKSMSPTNLRELNIRALEAKESLTEQEATMLADMKFGGAGSSSEPVDYVAAWKNKGW